MLAAACLPGGQPVGQVQRKSLSPIGEAAGGDVDGVALDASRCGRPGFEHRVTGEVLSEGAHA